MKKENLDDFYGWQAGLYDWLRPWFLFGRKKAVEALQPKQGEKVLDVACGTGLNVPLLEQYTSEITELDYAKSLLEVAHKKYDHTFVQGDVMNSLPGVYDGIICTYSLSMIEDPKKTVALMHESLKEHGRAVVLDFHPWNVPGYGLFRKWLLHHGVDPNKVWDIPFEKYFSVHKEYGWGRYYCIARLEP